MADMLSNLPHPLCSRAVYSINEACKIANLSRATMWREIEAGNINRVLYGRRARIMRTELVSYLERKPFQVELPKDHDPEARLNKALKMAG